MITHIEIDGFKSFHQFAIDLHPFQVFIGPNGAGKSNLFDAITLLSHVAGDNTLIDAFRKGRGEIGELFTLLPDGTRVREMIFAVEMLIAREIQDNSGVKAEVSATRLRYELAIEQRNEDGFERLYIKHESLRSIAGDDDQWVRQIPNHLRKDWIVRSRRAPYISTNLEGRLIYLHQDGRSGAKRETPLGFIERSILSQVNNAEYPTAWAARQEMLNWQFLQLDPVALRTPSNVYSNSIRLSADGSNLAAVLYRLSRENEYALTDISRDMANLVSGILDITVKPIPERSVYAIEAHMTDNNNYSSRVLSDGTLRLLTLVTLKNDPHYFGVLCLEEPENGVHPFRLKLIVELLQQLATNFRDEQEDIYPRQVLINTHSPSLLPYVGNVNVLFSDMRTIGATRQTRMFSVISAISLPQSMQESYYTLDQVRRFLDAEPIQQMREALTLTSTT